MKLTVMQDKKLVLLLSLCSPTRVLVNLPAFDLQMSNDLSLTPLRRDAQSCQRSTTASTKCNKKQQHYLTDTYFMWMDTICIPFEYTAVAHIV